MESTSNLAMLIGGLVCMGLFILAFLGGGAYLIYRSSQDKKKAKQSLNWPSTPGRVLESRVVESLSTDSDGDTSTTYKPYVKYEYSVIGATYTSDHIGIGPAVSSSNLRKAQDAVNRMPVGGTVTVFYNPDDPSDAVLEQRSNATVMLVVGIVLAAIGLCVLCPASIFLAVNWMNF
jgi:hypothetical protein